MLLENQEMARSRIGGAFGGPGGALALGGPWFGALALVVPWWPCRRVALDSVPGSPGPAQGHQQQSTLLAAALVALSCARGLASAAISPHLQSVQLRAPRDPFGSAGAQLIQDTSTGWCNQATNQQPSMWAHSRFWDMHALLALHHICTTTW